MPKGRSFRRIVAVLVFVILAVVGGIVGNRSDAGLLRLWPSFKEVALAEVELNSWIIAVILIISLCLHLTVFYSLRSVLRKDLSSRIA